ncbi:peptide chain release factor 2 [Desulfobacca acetoxidans]|uniref:Peptide chain release factor 2 n=1 Tax=Desulfobacca acetoxidans (strain ATCC 700848 / DSM 11109 / ASRB2) TaxID=880072 RepID=F2NC46_DESAR|nr:peptide chain release factor 2 [Desulfobacca acetoxidans]AEB08841.1 hypothetical protein Desac_0974 [Desulfobacca acetoxidans DSM 11109]
MLINPADLKNRLSTLSQRYSQLRGRLDLEKKKARLAEIEVLAAKPDFWQNSSQSSQILKERGALTHLLTVWQEQGKKIEDLEVLLELAQEETDEQAFVDVLTDLKVQERALQQLELEMLLGGEDDDKDAIITIHAGAGGTEAQDWAEMLLRMYLRFAERQGFRTEIYDLLPGDEAGVKSSTFAVSGPHAYGYLKSESGIHRLVRISPFDASGRRHTSFAAVFVYPEADEDIQIDLQEKDLRIDTFRASGAGGQHVNKTSSAVRLTHIPTGIVVSMQNERSQHRNRELAMRVLKSRLYELEKSKRQEKAQVVLDAQKDIAWGSQIRSYVLQPYRLIKDHRTKHEEGNVEAVLDGDLDAFIEAYLLSTAVS